ATTPIDVFANSFATSNLTYREGSRQGTMDSLKADNVTTGFYSVMSKEEGAWAGIKNVNLEGVTKLTLSVASKDAAGNIEIHLDLPNGPLLAVAEVPVTSPTNYNLGSSDVGVTELGYVNVAANFENNVTGTHDVYLVFKDPELLVSTISADSTPPTGDNVTGILTGQVQVNAGASLDVKYGLESVVGLSVLAEDITVTYDPTKMDFISIYSIDESKYRIVGQQPDAENGKIRFLAVRFGDAQTNPNGNMANLQFKTKKNAEAGISNISISNAVIGDEQGQETTIEGSTYSVQINVIDRGALESLISEAEALYSSAVEGTRIGQYPAGSKRLLRTEIDQALSVFNDDNATGVDIQQSATALNEAMQTFKNAVITSVGGDSNGDNQLTVGDLALVAKAYGMKSTDAGWNLVKQNDFNNDRKIDIEDIVWLALKIFNW
ncbi:cohesin domain-containing protein, partial [Paenibacillus sp. MCAF20]